MTATPAGDGRRSGALDRLRRLVGPRGWLEGTEATAAYRTDWRGLFTGPAIAVVRPATTAETADTVRLCREAGVAVVPQGGNTGMVGGGVPQATGAQIVLSTERLDRIRDIDPVDDTITVEAGVVLRAVQDAAAAVDRLFPLSLGAEGSCRIGGNLATNAGGVNVLRYGNARDLTLGLEVVLPDGRVWDGLRRLRKDNTGYDLKHLFIGAEGTLGVITAAVLKLLPRPRQVETALAAVAGPSAALAVLAAARDATGGGVTAFELMPRSGVDMATAHVPGTVDPLAGRPDWYVLIEATSPRADGALRETVEAVLGAGLEDGTVLDAVVAASEAQRAQLWRLREALVEGQARAGGTIKHDISVPVSHIPDFVAEATAALAGLVPDGRLVVFGHLGDGNLHVNLTQPAGTDRAAFQARTAEVNAAVHDIVARHAGSISAEHGIGQLKRAELPSRKSAVELDLMRAVKAALDPAGLMNPGKLL